MRYHCDLLGFCRRVGAEDGPPALANVVNVSRGGLGLLVNQSFEQGAVIALDAPLAGGRLLACVVHAKPRADGWCSLGCSFVTERTEEELRCFGMQPRAGETSDRRAGTRIACDLRATYRPLGVGERSRWHARVVNISTCGVGLLTDRAIEVGRALRLEVQGSVEYGPYRTLACVVRVERGEGGQWSWGCSFMREFTLRQLSGLVPYVVEGGAEPG